MDCDRLEGSHIISQEGPKFFWLGCVSLCSQLGMKEETCTGDLYSGLVTRVSQYLDSRYFLRGDSRLGLLPSSLRSWTSSSMFYDGVVVWARWVLGCMGEWLNYLRCMGCLRGCWVYARWGVVGAYRILSSQFGLYHPVSSVWNRLVFSSASFSWCC